jgi:hypothetical protein
MSKLTSTRESVTFACCPPAPRTPPVRHLANCAIVVGCKLEDLIEPEWRRWQQFDGGPPRPKHPEQLWKRGHRPTSSTGPTGRARDES